MIIYCRHCGALKVEEECSVCSARNTIDKLERLLTPEDHEKLDRAKEKRRNARRFNPSSFLRKVR